MSKCFFCGLKISLGCSNAPMTLIHSRGSFTSSFSSSSSVAVTDNAETPKLPWLSNLGMAGKPICNPFSAVNAKLPCLLIPDLPGTTLPRCIHPSRILMMVLKSGVSALTIVSPPSFLHNFAASSRTPSANPSSLHPAPQCLPMNAARLAKAEDERVKLCFFVNVRNATGRSRLGVRRIGNIVAR